MKPCRACKLPFEPVRPLQVACSVTCAALLVLLQRERKAKKAATADKKATREKLQKLKTRSQWAKDAEAVVNKYVRLRDAGKGCISCNKPATWGGQWHASHFRSVGAASAVRFHLWNIHKACSECNKWKSGNLSEYEPRLRALIGDEKVNWLRSQNQVVKHEVQYLQRLKKVFSTKANRLQKRLQCSHE